MGKLRDQATKKSPRPSAAKKDGKSSGSLRERAKAKSAGAGLGPVDPEDQPKEAKPNYVSPSSFNQPPPPPPPVTFFRYFATIPGLRNKGQ